MSDFGQVEHYKVVGISTNPDGTVTIHTSEGSSTSLVNGGGYVDVNDHGAWWDPVGIFGGWHAYGTYTSITTTDHHTVDEVWDSLTQNATPGATSTVSTGSVTDIYGLGSVTHVVDDNNLTVLNRPGISGG